MTSTSGSPPAPGRAGTAGEAALRLSPGRASAPAAAAVTPPGATPLPAGGSTPWGAELTGRRAPAFSSNPLRSSIAVSRVQAFQSPVCGSASSRRCPRQRAMSVSNVKNASIVQPWVRRSNMSGAVPSSQKPDGERAARPAASPAAIRARPAKVRRSQVRARMSRQ